MSGSIRCGMMRHQNVGAAARNASVDGLTNPRLEFEQITRQVENNFALFPIERVQLHAQFYAAPIRFSAAVASHAAHRGILCVIPYEVEESREEILKASHVASSGLAFGLR
jgi:hypothetical protein